MKTFLLSFAGGLLALILFFVVLPLMILFTVASGGQKEEVKGSIVLQLDLRGAYPDQAPTDGLGALFGQLSFVDILTKLHDAADDKHVKGLFIRASEAGVGSSRAEELRDAIQHLRDNGKFVITHSQGFFTGGASSYRAIAGSDEIWQQTGTDFSVPGFSLETLFYKGLLDTLEVSAEIEAFYEYKNAPNVYKEEGYTAAHADATRQLGESVWKVTLEDIAADRGDKLNLNGDLRAVLEDSPYSAASAREMGLIDNLGWPEQAAFHAQQLGGNADIVDIHNYIAPVAPADAPVIALIGGEGAILPGSSGGDPFNPGASSMIASDTLSDQIYRAGKNTNIKAIVLRVDSPGGSPSASDQIWNAIEHVQQEYSKPVVISMGSAAASGGYYISMGADKIVANRSTITGSIGVYGGKFAIADGLRKIGVNAERIDIGGPYASIYTSAEQLTDVQRAKMHESLERVYERFVSLAAEGRGMERDDLHALAKGRVWSGVDAQARGLVDQTGGLYTAVGLAKELSGIDADKRVRLTNMRKDVTPFEVLGSLFSASSDRMDSLNAIASIIGDERLTNALIQAQALEREPRQMAIAPIKEH